MAKISHRQIAEYAVDQLESGLQSDQLAKVLAAYLLDIRQTRELPKLMRAVQDVLAQRGRTQIEIVSAHQVSQDLKQQIKQAFGAQNPIFHQTIDPKIVGGFQAFSAEKQLDLSVRTKLNRFKTAVIRSNQ